MAESRSVVKLCGVAGFAFLALTGAALADGYEGSIKDAPAAKPEREFTYSFSLTGTSDYVFRGISQTDNDPTIQGSVGIGYGIFYAGAWGSGLDFSGASTGDDADLEIDYYAGIKPTWDKFAFDFGVIYYDYPGYSEPKNEALELKAGVSTTFDKLSLGATYYYSPDYNDKEYGVIELTAGYELPSFHSITPSITVLYGNQHEFDGASFDYSYWNAGLVLAVDKLTFDLRYWDTDLSSSECGGGVPSNLCDSRFVFSATVALP